MESKWRNEVEVTRKLRIGRLLWKTLKDPKFSRPHLRCYKFLCSVWVFKTTQTVFTVVYLFFEEIIFENKYFFWGNVKPALGKLVSSTFNKKGMIP